ncbi:hypothetical protein [Pseudonocardia acidicola]|uniref:ATP synthase protein I n=1 Tax=Pseudonocardia acidicola TaxID=2724939 RepID=A0ABX1SDX9_9PSEU|nr:hypothetical protein [Pseudonocardia acidicola]NMH99007.1 hypothetical protein [Pseudonocardia acidicola]
MSTDSAGDAAAPKPAEAPHVKTVLRLARAMQRNALILAAVTSVVAVVVSAVLRGGGGAVGAVVGAVLAMVAGSVSTLVMRATAQASPAAVMISAMTAFGGKIVVLLVFLILLRGTTLFDNQTFAITILAVTAAWIIGEIIGFVRTRTPVIDL